MLEQITPVILTYNEAPNLERTLDKLRWAKDIVIVDSFSTDETKAIAARYPQVRFFERPFDVLAWQWNYAIHETDIQTPWVLALDADYVLSDGAVEELAGLRPPADVDGYKATFIYCVYGRPLRGSLYPPVNVLFRKERVHVEQDGHAQRARVPGRVEALQHPFFHDDRKSLTRWLDSQRKYAAQETEKLMETPFSELPLQDRLRAVPFLSVGPALAYSLLLKGCIRDGWPGFFYGGQRAIAEFILGQAVAKRRLSRLWGR